MLAAIGNTPVVRLSRLPGPDHAEVWVKLEAANPTGSYKDRMSLAMIEGAERRGLLEPGGTVHVPDAPFVHVFVAKGGATLEGAGALATGDAVRLTRAGARALNADAATGAEVLIWETAGEPAGA